MKRLTEEERGWTGPDLEAGVDPAAPPQEDRRRRDRRTTEAHERGHAPPFQSAAAVSHGSKASGGEAPS